MRVLNEIDRYSICLESAKLISDDFNKFELTKNCIKELIMHKEYINKYGKDMDIINNWKWSN